MTTTVKIATIIITAEPNGRCVWLQRGDALTIHGCQLSEKEAVRVARDLAASLGATSGFSHFSDRANGGEES